MALKRKKRERDFFDNKKQNNLLSTQQTSLKIKILKYLKCKTILIYIFTQFIYLLFNEK